jgi:hypothetical protein
VRGTYGDEAACVEREVLARVMMASLPDTAVTVDVMQTCAALRSDQSCAEVAWGDPVECAPAGGRTDGSPCVDAVQCASRWCDGPPYGCGVCAEMPGTGAPCDVDRECARGYWCMPDGACGVPAGPGEPCDDVALCGVGLSCAAGACVSTMSAGDACDPEAGVNCDWMTEELVCNSGVCAAIAWAEPGEQCGWVSSVWTNCAGLTRCTATGDLSFCTNAPVDGGSCDLDAGPFCMWPAECVGGTCVGPADAADCG